MDIQDRAALPQCELCAPNAPLPAQGEIRYKGFAERERHRATEDTDEQ